MKREALSGPGPNAAATTARTATTPFFGGASGAGPVAGPWPTTWTDPCNPDIDKDGQSRQVCNQIKTNKGNGWGNLAKSLGIKPGSQEFKALKAGGDLKGFDSKNKAAGEKKSKSKGNAQEKGNAPKGK